MTAKNDNNEKKPIRKKQTYPIQNNDRKNDIQNSESNHAIPLSNTIFKMTEKDWIFHL
jgi:hypothetical protein